MAHTSAFQPFAPGFDFLQGLVQNAGAAMPGIGQWVAPTLDPQELDKRIRELRTVQFWLEQNARMLGATIQALEVQKMTLATLENLTGSGFNDLLTGSLAANRISGGAGNDVLNGGAGLDSLDGGAGSDIYLLALLADKTGAEIADTGETGTDELRLAAIAAGTLVLAAGDTGLERVVIGTGTAAAAVTTGLVALNVDASLAASALAITGNAGINTLTGTNYADTLIGNGGNDILLGGLGNDRLLGGLGKDTMTGGAGLDTFRFDTAPNATTNLDTITDFSLVDDTLELENAIFTALTATGALNAAYFRSGAGVITAADANDYLIYNTTTGALYYDANGSTAGAAIQIATFTTKPLLTASDFWIT